MPHDDWSERAVAALAASQAVIELMLEHKEMSQRQVTLILGNVRRVIAEAGEGAQAVA